MSPCLRPLQSTRVQVLFTSTLGAQHYLVQKRDSVKLLWDNCNDTYSYLFVNSYNCCSVAQSCPTLCDAMDRSMPSFPVLHYLWELAQTHVHWAGDAIQLSHPLLPPSPPAFNLSQHQGLFQWVSSSHQVAKVLEFQLQHQSFQWIFRTEMLKCKNSAPGEFKWFQTVRNFASGGQSIGTSALAPVLPMNITVDFL